MHATTQMTYRPGLSQLNLVLAALGTALLVLGGPLALVPKLDVHLLAAAVCFGGALVNSVRRVIVSRRGHGAAWTCVAFDLGVIALGIALGWTVPRGLEVGPLALLG